jgi:hypothetical protein
MQSDDLTGATLYDVGGNDIGKIEEIYKDDNGTPRYARIKIGTLLAKHRLVPIDAAQSTSDRITVPYSKDAIESAPDLPADVNPLSGMVAEDLRGYYAGTTMPASSRTSPPAATRAEDTATTEPSATPGNARTVSGDEIPTASEGAGGSVGQVRDRGDVVEIPVVEERLVKQPVVTEVIRVQKNSVLAEEKTVSADLRKEDVQVESEGDATLRNIGGQDD